MSIMPSDTDYTGFKVDAGAVTVLTLNSPKVNVFSTPVINDFIRALETLSKDPGLKVLVITGEGSTFLAGADIKEMSGYGPGEALSFARNIQKALSLVEKFPRPVIGAVNGFALGGGCELALACDIAIASESAVFGQPEIDIGIIPGAGGTQRLTRRIGAPRAKELIFTGRRVRSDEAASIGLINRVVPKDRLMEEALSLARVIAEKPAQCVEAAKALIDNGSYEKETEAFSKMFSYVDQKKLMAGFIRKKK